MFRKLRNLMNSITINGLTINGARSIDVTGGRVFVDGKEVQGLDISNNRLDIEVTGNLTSLKADGSMKLISGDVLGNAAAGGSLSCRDIGGNASAGGSIKAMSLAGNASAGGSVKINA
jgi:hypothetical protein